VEARYVSLLVIAWDPATRQMVMANAGALPPMICRDGDIQKLRIEGVPLGLLDSRQYEEVVFQARPGDTVLLYSDGVTDHVNAAGQEYGRARLSQMLRSHCEKPAADLIGAIFQDLDKFNTSAFDDQTLFAIQVR
jgi:sigma-B regulation protein RsbU (phosphoserine phosphatase)